MKIPVPKKLPSGKWRVQIYFNGKRHSITRDTKKECIKEVEYIKAVNNVAPSLLPDKPSNITLRQGFERYIEENSNTLAPGTLRSYNTCMNNHFQYEMDRPISEKHNWQKLINDFGKGRAAKTVHNNWSCIRKVLSVNNVSVPEINLPMIDSEEHPWLDFEQIAIFQEAIKGKPWELDALLALNGLRKSELLYLKKECIDVKKKTIHIHGAVVKGINGKVEKKSNKNKSSARDVPILIPRIIELYESRGDKPLLHYKGLTSLMRAIDITCLKNGLPCIGVHGLRHSFTSYCAHKGVPLEIVQKWGGWSDDTVLRKIYLHIADKDMRDYADMMRGSFK